MNLTPEKLARLMGLVYPKTRYKTYPIGHKVKMKDFELGDVMAWMSERCGDCNLTYIIGKQVTPNLSGHLFTIERWTPIGSEIVVEGEICHNILEAALSCAVALMEYLEKESEGET